MVRLKTYEWLADDEAILPSLEKWQRAIDTMTALLGASAGFVVEYNDKRGFRAMVSSSNTTPAPRDVPPAISPRDSHIFCRRVVQDKSAFYEPDATDKPDWQSSPDVTAGFVSYYGVPVLWPGGDVFGTICFFDRKPTGYSENIRQLIDTVRDLIEADLRLYEQYQIMRTISLSDPLTGLNNRAGFEMLAQQKIRIAKRYRHNVGMIFIDLNDMKYWNDVFGHAAGDAALQAVANAITDNIREVDICGRIGGDEFAILGYVRNRGDLTAIIARIRNTLSRTTLSVSSAKSPIHGHPQISAGAAVFFDPVRDSLEDMMHQADQEMYRDKKRKP